MIRVAVVESMRVRAETLAAAINGQHGMSCACTSRSVDDFVARINADGFAATVDGDGDTAIHVVLVTEGVASDPSAAARRIKQAVPGSRILMLIEPGHTELLARVIEGGVEAVLSADTELAELLAVMRKVRLDGGVVLDPSLLTHLAVPEPNHNGHSKPVVAPSKAGLTERELEVLRLLGTGADTTAIAAALGITINTTRGHVRSILQKLNAHSQLEAVVTAARLGLLPHLAP